MSGLSDVDGSLEIGAQIGYFWPRVEVFAAARYGLFGHESWLGELGGYYVARPMDKFVFRLGPRLLFGTDKYTDTYFGVSAEEANASQYTEFDPDGGLITAGLEGIATYQIADEWWLEGRVRWEKLQGDAADSPIVAQGRDDLFTVSIGFRRAIELDF